MKLIYNEASLKPVIYSIRNTHTGRIYIGQAKECKERWKSHISSLRNNHHQNKFLQNDFNKCLEELGADDFLEFEVLEIMEDSTKEERNQREEQVIAEHWGKNCYNLRKDVKDKEKSCWSKTPEETKQKLRNSMAPYRNKQTKTLNNYRQEAVIKSVQRNEKCYGKILDPNGNVFEIKNLEKFTREHCLHSRRSLQNVINGKIPSYKGWRKYDKKLIGIKYLNQLTEKHFAAKKFKLLSPNGEIFKGTNITKFCIKYNLRKENITADLNGRRKTFKGWRDADDPRWGKKKSSFKWNSYNHPRIYKFYLKTPEKNVISSINIRLFCLEHNLNAGCIGMVLKNKRKSHKGWTLPSKEEIDTYLNLHEENN